MKVARKPAKSCTENARASGPGTTFRYHKAAIKGERVDVGKGGSDFKGAEKGGAIKGVDKAGAGKVGGDIKAGHKDAKRP